MKESFKNISSVCVSCTVGTSKARTNIVMDKSEPTVRLFFETATGHVTSQIPI